MNIDLLCIENSDACLGDLIIFPLLSYTFPIRHQKFAFVGISVLGKWSLIFSYLILYRLHFLYN